MPISVRAEERDNGFWYLSELKLTVKRHDLFDDLASLSVEALSRLRKRKMEAQIKLDEINRLIESEKPHPEAEMTKVPYLWLVKNDGQKIK